MNSSRLILLVVASSLLFSCASLQPRIPGNEIPAGPFLQALERRLRSFSTLKTTASLQVARKERRRIFENAGILVQGGDRFRIEAYGPLGDTLATLVWAGQDVQLEYEGTRRVMSRNGSGLERVLGSDVDPSDLAEILAGNVPGMLRAASVKLFCEANGTCVLALGVKDGQILVHANQDWDSKGMVIRSCEVLHNRALVYRVRYESFAEISGYLLPKNITVENPANYAVLTVQYFDAEVNVPLDARDFVLPGGER